jgi:hypothetical protein
MSTQITRLLPFRDYSEHDVINMYSLDAVTGEAGSLVGVSSANLDNDPVTLGVDGGAYLNTLGNAYSPYPSVPHKVTKVTATGQPILGILLRDVRSTDENGQSLQFDSVKRDELQCVLTGQAVPIAKRGRFMFANSAFAGGVTPAVNDSILPATNGTLTGVTAPSAAQLPYVVGKVLGTGLRVSEQDTDAFAGGYALIDLNVK